MENSRKNFKKKMALTLKKAYSACLWLAERKLGIPPEQQRGQWDLSAKDSKLDVSRRSIVTNLPDSYFDMNSCYLGEIYEGEYDGVEFIDASNFIDGPIFKYVGADAFQTFSPFRESPFFFPSGDEKLNFDDNSHENLTGLNFPLLLIEQLNQGSCSDDQKPHLAEVSAHITLSKMLEEDELKTTGFQRVIKDIPHLTDKRPESRRETIPSNIWRRKTIPNYADSALEVGLNRYEELELEYLEEYHHNKDRADYLSKSEIWYSYINIENHKVFESWLMTEVHREFPNPTHAIFKPQGKGYLIQFGTDEPTVIKGSKGISLIYKILKEYRKNSYNLGSGYSAEAIELDLLHDTSINKRSMSTQHGFEEKLRNQLTDLLSLYFETDDIDQKEKLEETIYLVLDKIDKLVDVTPFSKRDIKSLLSKDADHFESHLESIKLSFKVDKPEEMKEIDGHRKNVENALVKLAEQCPHLAQYLGSLTSKKTEGLGYSKENQELYFICNDDIQWDFG